MNGLNVLAAVHTSFLLPGSFLQCQSVPLHRTLLSSFIPGSGSHENSLCSDTGMAAV